MQYPCLSFNWKTTPSSFVTSWSQLYSYPMEHLYEGNIHKRVFSIVDIAQLYEWKNGRRLSRRKQATFDTKIIAKLNRINDFKQELYISEFRNVFADISTIWKLFLLHIIAPGTYPIFDQHVFRAYKYLTTRMLQEIPLSNNQKDDIYFQYYLPFFNGMVTSSSQPRKKVDEALFTFGRFLKTIYGRSIHGEHIDVSIESDDFE